MTADLSPKFDQILGVRFFNGTADEAVNYISEKGGYTVVPAAPALVKLQYGLEFREAIAESDLAIPDSGLMVILWRLLRGRRLRRLSGLAYLKALVNQPGFGGGSNKVLWIVPSESARTKARQWAQVNQFVSDNESFYIAPRYSSPVRDETLLKSIESQRPNHIVIGIGGGPQEKLGRYLRNNLQYRPAIHCVGAALGFLTGDQVAIPNWADRFYLGWLLRLFAQPSIFIPRLARALVLPWLIFRYGENLPPMKHQAEAKW